MELGQPISPALDWARYEVSHLLFGFAAVLTVYVALRAGLAALIASPINRAARFGSTRGAKRNVGAAAVRTLYQDGMLVAVLGAWIGYYGWTYCILALRYNAGVFGAVGVFLTTLGVFVAVSALLEDRTRQLSDTPSSEQKTVTEAEESP